MAKAPVVEDARMRHAFKVAAVTRQTPARDAALLHVLYGTGMTATELAQLEVADVLDERGGFKRESHVRSTISFNGRPRPVYWTNVRVCEALDAYFMARLRLCTASRLGAPNGAAWCTSDRCSSRTTVGPSP